LKEIILTEEWYMIDSGDNAECFVNKEDDDVLLKLFLSRFSKEDVEKEFLSSKAAERYFHAPASREMVRVDGRYGILFDRVHGITLTEVCEQDPDNIRKYAELYVDELKKTHAASIEDEILPSTTDIMLDAVDHVFRSKQWKKNFGDMAARIAREFPKEVLIHGDRHPGNVMIQNGEPVWIDLGYVAKGPAVYDLSSLHLIWILPIAPFFLPSAAEIKMNKATKKEFYEIVVKAFAEMNHKTDIVHVKWLIRQSMILFVILSLYREGWGEVKSRIWNGITNSILKAVICLVFIWYRKER